jgi:hypothetical protein
MRAHASTARAIDTLTNECEEAEQGIRLVAVSAGEAIPVFTEARSYGGRQLNGARIDQGGRPAIRNVAEADPGDGIGSPQRPSAAGMAE